MGESGNHSKYRVCILVVGGGQAIHKGEIHSKLDSDECYGEKLSKKGD